MCLKHFHWPLIYKRGNFVCIYTTYNSELFLFINGNKPQKQKPLILFKNFWVVRAKVQFHYLFKIGEIINISHKKWGEGGFIFHAKYLVGYSIPLHLNLNYLFDLPNKKLEIPFLCKQIFLLLSFLIFSIIGLNGFMSKISLF